VTADDIIDAAMARCTDLGASVPTTKSVMYRRIGVRQSQIFSFIADANPEFLGRTAIIPLTAGQYDLATLPAPKAERVTDIRVSNPGTSGLVTRERINLVTVDDVDAHLPPRVVVRDQVIQQVENDLAGVVSLTLYYSRKPTATAIIGTTAMELPDQFQDLLVLDIAKQSIRKLLDVEPQRRDGWIDLLSAEEKSLLSTLSAHVRHFVLGEQNRFRPLSPAPEGGDKD
jgi:hypothetical protein